MLNKRVEDITKPDIESLIENSVPEGRMLDYKDRIPSNQDEEKRDFLSDVCAFANAGGGTMLFGIPEVRESGRNTGVPASCDGIAGLNVDAERLRLEQSIRDGIAPRIQGIRIEAVAGFRSGSILLIRIPKSFLAPHMVTFKNLSRFFIRTNAGNSQMDVVELRSAFLDSEEVPARIRQFHADRVSKVLAADLPTKILGSGRVVVHLIPLVPVRQRGQVDLSPIGQGRLQCPPLLAQHCPPRFNLDGVLMVDEGRDGTFGYTQVFRDGSIEAVDGYILADQDSSSTIPSVTFESAIRESLPIYRNVLRTLQVTGPVVLFISLLNVRGFRLGHHFRVLLPRATAVDRDHVLLPEIVLEEDDLDVDKQLRPLFDMVWQACGMPNCMNYNVDGTWGRMP